MDEFRAWIDDAIASGGWQVSPAAIEVGVWMVVAAAAIGLGLIAQPAIRALFGIHAPRRRAPARLARPLASRISRMTMPRIALHGGLMLSLFAVIVVAQRDKDAFELPTVDLAKAEAFFERISPQMVVLRQPTFGTYSDSKPALVSASMKSETLHTEKSAALPEAAQIPVADQLATAKVLQSYMPVESLRIYSELRLTHPDRADIWLETASVLEGMSDTQAALIAYEAAFNTAARTGDRDNRIAALSHIARLSTNGEALPESDDAIAPQADQEALLDAMGEQAQWRSGRYDAYLKEMEAPIAEWSDARKAAFGGSPDAILGALGFVQVPDTSDLPVIDADGSAEK